MALVVEEEEEQMRKALRASGECVLAREFLTVFVHGFFAFQG